MLKLNLNHKVILELTFKKNISSSNNVLSDRCYHNMPNDKVPNNNWKKVALLVHDGCISGDMFFHEPLMTSLLFEQPIAVNV
jgi:hypothetical protein